MIATVLISWVLISPFAAVLFCRVVGFGRARNAE